MMNNPTGVVTRLARPAEIEPAVDIWQQANIARGKIASQQRIARVRAKLTDPSALVIVAADDAGLVGMALAEPGRDQDGSGSPLPGLCHISMVFVHPGHWGRHIGQYLIDAVAEHADRRGHTDLQLWTGDNNQRAQRLYRRTGFLPSGRTKQLGTGEAVIHLVRSVAARYDGRR
jgi:ribosomal protein S18 acetylase RimI-like enzyme